jgi:hypothetical protein
MERNCLFVVVLALIFICLGRALVQGDEEGEPDAEHDDRDQEMTIGKNRSKLFSFRHWVSHSMAQP